MKHNKTRSTSIVKVISDLVAIIDKHCADHELQNLRVFSITVKERRGDVEILLGHLDASKPSRAITYSSEGVWSGVSFWSEDQI